MKSAQESAPIWPLLAAMRCAVWAKHWFAIPGNSFSKFNDLIVRKTVHFPVAVCDWHIHLPHCIKLTTSFFLFVV
jgi:hypothetical protein